MRWVTWHADNREENGVKEEYLRIVIYEGEATHKDIGRDKRPGRVAYTIDADEVK